jgi:hypothetical protein
MLSPSWHDMHPDPDVADMDDCPNCGGSLGDRPRAHRCREPRDIPPINYHDHGRPL